MSSARWDTPVARAPGPEATTSQTLALARPATRRMVLAVVLGAGAVGASIALMGTSAWLISRAAQHPSEAALTLGIAGVQVFGLSRGFLRYGERLVGHDAALRLLRDLRVQVYRHLEQLAPSGLPLFRRGDLLARLVDDVDALQDVVLRVFAPFAVAALVGGGVVGVMWAILPSAGALVLAILVLAAVAVPWLTGFLTASSEAHTATARGELTTRIVDLVEGAPELLVAGAMGEQLERVNAADRRLRELARRGSRTVGIGLALTTLLTGVACWGSLTLGVHAYADGRVSGVLLAVLALVPLACLELLTPLPAATRSLAQARQAAGRVLEVTGARPWVHDPAQPLELPPPPYRLALRDVWARYPSSARAALRGIDLELVPGRRLAVVGPSGAGKSTLAAVLLRFVPFESGEVHVNGQSLDRLCGDDVRRVVGLVDQEPHLFNTTLAENLRVARRGATDDELREVLARVGLGSWVDSLPAGLATEVGRFGTAVSGGQRQRIAVARALLADFPVLVADEPAEHLEAAAADSLIEDLLDTTGGRALLLITHRLAGLDRLDEILVMDRGRICERGTHEALLRAGGRYAALWWEEQLHQPTATEEPSATGPGIGGEANAEAAGGERNAT